MMKDFSRMITKMRPYITSVWENLRVRRKLFILTISQKIREIQINQGKDIFTRLMLIPIILVVITLVMHLIHISTEIRANMSVSRAIFSTDDVENDNWAENNNWFVRQLAFDLLTIRDFESIITDYITEEIKSNDSYSKVTFKALESKPLESMPSVLGQLEAIYFRKDSQIVLEVNKTDILILEVNKIAHQDTNINFSHPFKLEVKHLGKNSSALHKVPQLAEHIVPSAKITGANLTFILTSSEIASDDGTDNAFRNPIPVQKVDFSKLSNTEEKITSVITGTIEYPRFSEEEISIGKKKITLEPKTIFLIKELKISKNTINFILTGKAKRLEVDGHDKRLTCLQYLNSILGLNFLVVILSTGIMLIIMVYQPTFRSKNK